MASIPISIRTKNPGAMWGSALSEKWGATGDIMTGDSQGNHIAVFPTYIQGACAQFDLWRRSYCNMTLSEAVTKWSGGNSSATYLAFLRDKTGIIGSEMITKSLLAGPSGLSLMKAQAEWEAGRKYPLTDAEWATAQKKVFATTTQTKVVATGGVVAAGAAVQQAVTGNWQNALAIVIFAAIIGAVVYLYLKWRKT